MQHEIEDLSRRVKAAKGNDKKALQMELEERRQALQIEFPGGAPVPALDPKLFRPEPGLWQGYARPVKETASPAPGSIFDPNLVVLSLSGHRLTLPSTLKLLQALRNAVMKNCPQQPPPEWLSGHTPDGKPSGAPHLTFLPLPFVGREHSDGKLMGVALALPRDLDAAEADRCLGALLRDESGLPHSIRLFDGQWFDCQAEWETRESPPWSLRPETWTGPARRWASVTPVVLDRHFDGKDKWEQAAESVKTACERIGLPRPSEVLLHPVSMFEGVPRGNEFPPITRKSDGGRMHHAHAVIVFDEDVIGPVLAGAGRFRGYGLCRPLPQGGEDA
jgi:CRISPR-associated protein Csb2